MWKEKATDYRRFRLDRLNTPEFKHLKYLLFWPVYGFFFLLVARTYQELESKCDEALRQIDEQKYEEALRQEGYSDILKYGIAFYRKECMVK